MNNLNFNLRNIKIEKDIYTIEKRKVLRENLESPLEFSTHKILPQPLLTICAAASIATRT